MTLHGLELRHWVYTCEMAFPNQKWVTIRGRKEQAFHPPYFANYSCLALGYGAHHDWILIPRG